MTNDFRPIHRERTGAVRASPIPRRARQRREAGQEHDHLCTDRQWKDHRRGRHHSRASRGLQGSEEDGKGKEVGVDYARGGGTEYWPLRGRGGGSQVGGTMVRETKKFPSIPLINFFITSFGSPLPPPAVHFFPDPPNPEGGGDLGVRAVVLGMGGHRSGARGR